MAYPKRDDAVRIHKLGEFEKRLIGKAREYQGMRRTRMYAAVTRDEAQRSIWTFYEFVKYGIFQT